MSRIAVDIVLLPGKMMTGYAIAANAELVKNFSSPIVLNTERCLPHISLAMGCIDSDDIPQLSELLRSLVAVAPKTLKLTGIQKSTSFSGETVSVLRVERSKQLQKVHENICEAVEPYFTYDVTEDMVAGSRASSSTLLWIKNYLQKSSYSNFSPHITIGYGDLSDRPLAADFAVSHLALCRLGNNCTCVKILWSVEI